MPGESENNNSEMSREGRSARDWGQRGCWWVSVAQNTERRGALQTTEVRIKGGPEMASTGTISPKIWVLVRGGEEKRQLPTV